ncbi:MAG TPA: phosphatidylglycerol lysyltransferase domain-containing protein, partial [Flavisolibacter sp.]|nr:phosphatidylglycerol lysyltransferase domain-containing protein [Flavisolibacter sp.]
KAFDYEEAIIAAAVFIILLCTRNYYKMKSNPKLVNTGLRVAMLSFVALLIYGFVGFYFLEKKHFGVDFTWKESIIYSIRGFFMLEPAHLHPLTRFGTMFLRSFYFMGGMSWLFLLYTLIRPYLKPGLSSDATREEAKRLLQLHGNSVMDHFKVSDDKLIFLSKKHQGFISYSLSRTFAIALEEPVCAPEDKRAILKEFEDYCHKLGLKTAYYRIDEKNLDNFSLLRKKKLLIGQEAILDVNTFELTGRSKKSLRNGLNSLQKKGYTTIFCAAPHNDLFLSELKDISDEWLEAFEKKEMVFAQGSFEEEELKEQDIIATFDSDGKVVAFLNIIPDYAPEECTYDLIRKTSAAPGGCMDALIIELISYCKEKGARYLNLGLVPMAGIEQPENTAEQMIQFAYKKIKRFRQYHGLREFKEKYATEWLNKYLVFETDFDLLQLPQALNKVMQPSEKAPAA